jgi:CPA2 family monovalent cation:H+ antiporter-2
MHAEAFIQDLAVIMLVAGLVTLLFHQVKVACGVGLYFGGGVNWPSYATFCLNS